MRSTELHYPKIDPWEPRKRRRHRRHRRRRRLPHVSWFNISLTVLLFIIAIIGVLILFPPAAPPPPTEQQQQEAKTVFKAIKENRDEAHKDAKAGKPHPGAEHVTEDQLNTFLATDAQAQLELGKKEIEGAFVRIGDGTIRATASRRSEED